MVRKPRPFLSGIILEKVVAFEYKVITYKPLSVFVTDSHFFAKFYN